MTYFVFCHGLGFNVNFWNHLAHYFSQEKCLFIDLGYFNNPTNYLNLPNTNELVVGIGHSIGLLKLSFMYNKFNYLIGLNSFNNFLSTQKQLHHKRQKELNAIRNNFLKDPVFTLTQFYARSGIPEFINETINLKLNLNLILSDLKFLEKNYILPSIPTLILSSNHDIIVPNEVILDNFSRCSNVKIDYIKDLGHNIGFKKPLEVYKKIMSFLNEPKS